MANGYWASARESENSAAATELKAARYQLIKIDNEDSRCFADQLRDVHVWLKARQNQGDAQ